ncbi:hypothetical protein ACWEHA_26410 [Amycolatopsis nivea]
MATVHYCRAWGGENHAMGQPLTERTAKRRYEEKGRWFTAVVGDDPSRPACTLEINPREAYPITVKFFDDHGSTRLSYAFWLMEPGKLFLKQVTRWEYPADGQYHGMNESTLVETLFWEQPDGVVRRLVNDGTTVHAEDYRDVPIDANWEPYPAFGDFASISREDRDQPPGPA